MYCRRCGTPLHQGVVICPECGARQRKRASSVRCASCDGRVPMGLSVCPHCGRDVRPAGPRWGSWIAGLAILFLAGLWGLGKLPVERIHSDVVEMRARLAGYLQVLGPTSGSLPPGGTSQPGAQTLALAAATPTAAPQPTEPRPSGEEPAAAPETSTPSRPAPETPTAAAPSETPTPLPPTVTETPPPTTTTTPMPPTATAAPTTAPPAAGGQLIYRVKAGDTLYGIAQQYNVSVDALIAANRISSGASLQIGQTLVIPGTGIPPTPTPQPQPVTSPTPSPLPPTPMPYLAAPVLLNPGDQSSFKGDKEQIELQWQPIPGMPAGDNYAYQVIIRWDEQGVPQEYSLPWPSTTVSIGNRIVMPFPGWLWGRADQPARQYKWFVRAVQLATDGQGGQRIIPMSPASQTSSFFWN